MLVGDDVLGAYPITARQRRQALGVLVLLIIEAFLIELEEAVKLDDRAGGAKGIGLAVAALGAEIGGRAFDLCTLHLARNGAFPDRVHRAPVGRHRDGGGYSRGNGKGPSV